MLRIQEFFGIVELRWDTLSNSFFSILLKKKSINNQTFRQKYRSMESAWRPMSYNIVGKIAWKHPRTDSKS